MQIKNSKLNTFSCILTKLYGIYMIQKYKKKAEHTNISMFKCYLFSIFNYKIVYFWILIHTFAYEKFSKIKSLWNNTSHIKQILITTLRF